MYGTNLVTKASYQMVSWASLLTLACTCFTEHAFKMCQWVRCQSEQFGPLGPTCSCLVALSLCYAITPCSFDMNSEGPGCLNTTKCFAR